MTEMNGEGVMPPVQLGPNQIVQLLSEVLEFAKQGNVATIAMVVIGPQGQTQTPVAGQRLGDLYTGAGLLKRRVEDILLAVPVQTVAQRIMRVPGLPGL